MQKLLFVIFLFCTGGLSAQTANISSFIPKGYDTLFGGFANGDLNTDGTDDVVLALYNATEKEDMDSLNVDSIAPRLLVILLGTTNGYIQSETSSAALLCRGCGGIFGDPFNGISIEKSVLVISHYGGSNWRWSI